MKGPVVDTRETIIEIVGELCPATDCETCTTLVDDRHLDSLAMVALVADLEDNFDIEIPPVHVVPENFNSVDAICALVEKLMEDAD